MLANRSYSQRLETIHVYSGLHAEYVTRLLKKYLRKAGIGNKDCKVLCENDGVKLEVKQPYKNRAFTLAKDAILGKIRKKRTKLRSEVRSSLYIPCNYS
jgi:hypothetical protein